MSAAIPPFPEAAREALADHGLRANLRFATETIRDKRARVVAEVPDWEELREAGRAIKADVLEHLDGYLVQFEQAFEAAGGHVHWAATPPTRTGSCSASPARTGSPRSSRSSR